MFQRDSIILSRRQVIAGGTSALAMSLVLGPTRLQAQTARAEAAPAGFLGDNTLLLLVHDGQIIYPESTPVPPDADIRFDRDPTSRFGGLGQLNGAEVHFSGGSNRTIPQLATPWPQFQADAANPAFRAGRNGKVPADAPKAWSVKIADAEARVVTVARKTVPVASAEIARNDIVHKTRHLLTLTLDRPIASGAQIEIAAPLQTPLEFARTETTPCELIHICQKGYPLAGPKAGYIGLWLGHDSAGNAVTSDPALSPETTWQLIDTETQMPVTNGTLDPLPPSAFNDRPLTGCTLYRADFSAINQTGSYQLVVDGFGASHPFEITAHPYQDVLRAAARWYYHQRSGIAIDAPYGEGITRPRNGHPEDGLDVWQSTVRLVDTSEGLGGPYAPQSLRDADPDGATRVTDKSLPRAPHAWGGWHDAGDWDRRAQHLEVVYAFAWMIEHLPSLRDLDLNLPESGHPFADPAIAARKSDTDLGDQTTVLPDLIHEALWGISLWRRTLGPEGQVIGGVEYSQIGTAGSYSWDPVELAYAYAPDPWSAYLFAAAAAKLGQVIAEVCGDKTLGETLLAEAALAWTWAESQSAPLLAASDDKAQQNKARTVLAARVAAAATVYRATGLDDARQVFEANHPFGSENAKTAGLRPAVYTAQSLDYHFAAQDGRDVDPDLSNTIRDWVRTQPARQSDQRLSEDFGLHSTSEFPWGRGWLRFGPGSNWPAHRHALAYALDQEVTEDARATVTEGMWFALGNNPSNVSFVQGMGTRDFADPLLIDRRRAAPIPGQIAFGVAGGPLHKWEQDRAAGAIYPTDQNVWPLYAQIYESRVIAICSEHGMKSNALEWLMANALNHEFETRRT